MTTKAVHTTPSGVCFMDYKDPRVGWVKFYGQPRIEVEKMQGCLFGKEFAVLVITTPGVPLRAHNFSLS
jgi:hypothetical protein